MKRSRFGILKWHNSKGLTMVEVLMSLTLLAIVCLSCMFVLIQSKQMAEDARYRLVAANAAKSALDMIKNTPLTSIDTIDTDALIPDDLPNGTMTITTNPESLTGVSLATVRVRVQWTGAGQRARTLDIMTQRSSY